MKKAVIVSIVLSLCQYAAGSADGHEQQLEEFVTTCTLAHQRQNRFYDSFIPTGMIELDGIERTDISAEWQWTKNATAGLAVDNVFGKGFEEAMGFTNPSRQFRLTLTTEL